MLGRGEAGSTTGVGAGVVAGVPCTVASALESVMEVVQVGDGVGVGDEERLRLLSLQPSSLLLLPPVGCSRRTSARAAGRRARKVSRWACALAIS